LSKQSEALLQKTSSPHTAPAVLVLEDGTVFEGRSCGKSGEVCGEICFDTSMIGYEEVLVDPKNAGKLVTMTYPQIGNYGINRAVQEGKSATVAGLVVHSLNQAPSSWLCDVGLTDYLTEEGIVAIEDIDTRVLVRHIRNKNLAAIISTENFDVPALVAKLKETSVVQANNVGRGVE